MNKLSLIAASISALAFGSAAFATPPPASQPRLSVLCRNPITQEISGSAIGHFIKFDGKALQVLKLVSAEGDMQTVAVLDGDCTIEPLITFDTANSQN